MLLEAAREWGIALDRSFMVGDRWRDVSAGCRTILIGDGYGESFRDTPDAVVESLQEACRLILSRRDWA